MPGGRVTGEKLPCGRAIPALEVARRCGYDAEWVHQTCQEKWKVESWIKPVIHRKDGSWGGIHRSAMTREALNQAGYGKRWHIESFIGGMKRLCEAGLTARLDITQRHETLLRLPAYTLYR